MNPTASARLESHWPSITERVREQDWASVRAELDNEGYSLLQGLLNEEECEAIATLYGQSSCFRARVVMARHGFGRGEYQYFRYPLPGLVAELRSHLWTRLAPVANSWNRFMNRSVRFPRRHADFLGRCHAAGQTRPTPLLLDYGPGDYNCLHQDLYGEHVFPLQVAVLLSEPQRDFVGGEFVLTEQRPRRQSRAQVVPLGKGDAVIFAVHQRPAKGARGYYRVTMRHGVSKIRTGSRRTLGIIFHDAT